MFGGEGGGQVGQEAVAAAAGEFVQGGAVGEVEFVAAEGFAAGAVDEGLEEVLAAVVEGAADAVELRDGRRQMPVEGRQAFPDGPWVRSRGVRWISHGRISWAGFSRPPGVSTGAGRRSSGKRRRGGDQGFHSAGSGTGRYGKGSITSSMNSSTGGAGAATSAVAPWISGAKPAFASVALGGRDLEKTSRE